jgi:hypothetical protein
MKERAKRAVDLRRGLVDRKIAHVALAKVEVYSRLDRADASQLQHGRREVDPDDASTGRRRNRDRDPAVSDCELNQRTVCPARQVDIEADVGRHMRRPLLIVVGEGLVPAHRHMVTARTRREPLDLREQRRTQREW